MKHKASPDPFSRQASRATEARDAERERLARELHDALGNTLAALKLESHLVCSALERKLAHTPEVDLARILQRSRQIHALLDEAIESTRDMVRDNHPRVLRQRGLTGAIEMLVARFSLHTGITHTISSIDAIEPVDEAQALALYRVAQEALSNIARHAKAGEVVIHLRQHNDCLHLEIHDNGIGLPPQAAAARGFGLSTMRERMLAVGGEFSIDCGKDGGTRITCRTPALSVSTSHSGRA